MTNTIAQIGLTIFGCAAIWFVGRKESWRRWGFIFGMLSQPFWFYTAWKHEQWGIFILCLWYTYSWGQGIWNFWVPDWKAPPEYARVGNTALALKKIQDNRALYFRDAGQWSVKTVRKGWSYYVDDENMGHLQGEKVHRISQKDWTKDNEGYL